MITSCQRSLIRSGSGYPNGFSRSVLTTEKSRCSFRYRATQSSARGDGESWRLEEHAGGALQILQKGARTEFRRKVSQAVPEARVGVRLTGRSEVGWSEADLSFPIRNCHDWRGHGHPKIRKRYGVFLNPVNCRMCRHPGPSVAGTTSHSIWPPGASFQKGGISSRMPHLFNFRMPGYTTRGISIDPRKHDMLDARNMEPVATTGKVPNVRFPGTEVFHASEAQFIRPPKS